MQADCKTWRSQQRLVSVVPLSTEQNMGESIDQQLRLLVHKAQSQGQEPGARQAALTSLIMAIGQSGQLARLRKYAQYYVPSVFDDLYNEALQDMYEYICNKIDLYRP
ncbi:MAG: hypothetical protein WA902_11890, partial [Thermosynechococcaceae cyanobacterium]